jgi:hypothetical protein
MLEFKQARFFPTNYLPESFLLGLSVSLFVAKSNGKLRIISQQDHADFAAQFAAHWGNSSFSVPRPYESMIIATGEHDNGWWEYDLRPLVDENGEPINFFHVPRELHSKFYKNGIDRVIGQDKYAGLMVVMHTIGLFNERYGTDKGPIPPPFLMDDPRYKDFLKTMESERKELLTKLESSEEFKTFSAADMIWRNYRLLQVFDRLAIHFCWVDEPSDGSIFPVPSNEEKVKQADDVELNITKIDRNTFSMSPYPLDDDFLLVSLRARYVPDRKYVDHNDFRKELSRQERRNIQYRIVNGNQK